MVGFELFLNINMKLVVVFLVVMWLVLLLMIGGVLGYDVFIKDRFFL